MPLGVAWADAPARRKSAAGSESHAVKNTQLKNGPRASDALRGKPHGCRVQKRCLTICYGIEYGVDHQLEHGPHGGRYITT